MPETKISIGLPVYNGSDSLERAIKSLLGQSFYNLELIISDNCSTDATESICRKYTKLDSRIRYIRQKYNIGAINNFKYVLGLACGEFFMWAAHDDFWEHEFIDNNIRNLENNTHAIASISNVLLDGRKYDEKFSGVKPLTGEFRDRLLSFLNVPGANSRFYSIFRKQSLSDINLDQDYLGKDWSIIVELIHKGDMLTLLDYHGFNKSLSGAGSSIFRFKIMRKKWIEWFFPYALFSTHVIKHSIHPRVIARLLIINMGANKSRIKGSFSHVYKHYINLLQQQKGTKHK